VLNVGEIKSWLSEKVTQTESSRDTGLPAIEIPRIPEPKPRRRSGYTIVLIGESGKPRQLELSALQLRLVGIGSLLALAVIVALSITAGTLLMRPGGKTTTAMVSVDKSSSLRESASRTNEKLPNDKPGEKASASSAGQSVSPIDAGRETVAEVRQLAPSQSVQAPAVAGETGAASTGSLSEAGVVPRESSNVTRSVPETYGTSSGVPVGPVASSKPPSQNIAATNIPSINFNAQEVTATTDGSNNGGNLSFRLSKDKPDLRFAGYLFVFVEMEDSRGENKIYVYPRDARLGEGDLPSDYKEGEGIAFKFNSRVELPYGDMRSGSHLARVSILLYNETGKIVFQRGFDRAEMKIAGGSKTEKTDGSKPKTEKKRQAL
jgi:hypothetical protein